MRKKSTLNSPIKHLVRCIAMRRMLVMVLGLLLMLPAWAQGSSIPTSSAVQEQREAIEQLSEELPEGVKYRYPLLNGMSVSVNLFPPLMNLFGKEYGNYEGMVTFDLHHRFFPQAGAGIGFCDVMNDDSVRYHCTKHFPFFKAGMLYNFNYNDLKPNDFYGAFVRFGYAYSEAKIKGLRYTDAFWGKTDPMTIDGLAYHSVWMELGGFIKVQVAKHISLGWDVSFKPFLHKGKEKQGEPYFVPGYGVTSNKLGFGFHLYYDI